MPRVEATARAGRHLATQVHSHAGEPRGHALYATRVINPRNRHLGREQLLDAAPRVDELGSRARRGHARERGVERGSVEAGVVEGATGELRVEHRRKIREREVARDSGEERVESFWRRARFGQERAELELSNLER